MTAPLRAAAAVTIAALACGQATGGAAPTSADGPQARIGAALAADPASGDVVLFGGRGRTGLLADTWRWSGRRWHRAATAAAPAARSFAAAASNGHGGVLLFGGDQAGAVGAPDDTWRWDGGRWLELHPSVVPDGGAYRVMAAGPDGAPVLVVAGADRVVRTWAWDAGAGAGRDWRPAPGGAAPPWRDAAAMALDRATGRLILFGGVAADGTPAADTWSWDGRAWNELRTAHRPGGGPASMADLGPEVLLFERDGTWAWTGADWTPLRPPHQPPWQPYAVLAAIPGTAAAASPAILLLPAQTWRWTGSDWTLV